MENKEVFTKIESLRAEFKRLALLSDKDLSNFIVCLEELFENTFTKKGISKENSNDVNFDNLLDLMDYILISSKENKYEAFAQAIAYVKLRLDNISQYAKEASELIDKMDKNLDSLY